MHDLETQVVNTWGEEIRLKDVVSWGDESVERKMKEFIIELQDKELTSRRREVIERMLGRLSFELDSRGIASDAEELQLTPETARA